MCLVCSKLACTRTVSFLVYVGDKSSKGVSTRTYRYTALTYHTILPIPLIPLSKGQIPTRIGVARLVPFVLCAVFEF